MTIKEYLRMEMPEVEETPLSELFRFARREEWPVLDWLLLEEED